jgi:hypothetical protein
MMGSGIGSFLTNPKYIFKAAYLSTVVFGSFFGARLAFGMLGTAFVSRFGKPSLVRETSKIHSTNPITLPLMYAKRMVHKF